MTGAIATTLGALVNAEAALVKIAAVPFDKEGGAKVRYHVVKLAKLVSVETKHFYDERNALIEQYGSGAPKSIQPDAPTLPAFTKAATECLAVPVTLPWGPITDVMVEPYPTITGADLIALGPLYELDPAAVTKD